MKQEKKSSIIVALAGIFWGLLGLFVRKVSSFGFDTEQITFLRMLWATIIIVLYFLFSDRQKLKIEIKDIWMFFCTGFVCVFLHNVTYFYAILNGEASVATVLVYTSPVFVTIASVIVFKEKMTVKKIVALLLTILGCVFVSGVIGGKIITKPLVIFVGISAGFFYGMYTIFSKIALKKYSSETVCVYTFVFSFIGSLFTNNVPKTLAVMCSSLNVLFWCICASVVACLIPFFLYSVGLRNVDSSKAAIMASLDPVVATLIGIFFLRESHSIVKIIGILLVSSSIVLLNLKDKRGTFKTPFLNSDMK